MQVNVDRGCGGRYSERKGGSQDIAGRAKPARRQSKPFDMRPIPRRVCQDYNRRPTLSNKFVTVLSYYGLQRTTIGYGSQPAKNHSCSSISRVS